MSVDDEGRDIGALLERDAGGPPPEIDARIRAYARERGAAVRGEDGAPAAAGEASRRVVPNAWRRVLPAVAVVALAVTLVPLVRDEAPSGSVREAPAAAPAPDEPDAPAEVAVAVPEAAVEAAADAGANGLDASDAEAFDGVATAAKSMERARAAATPVAPPAPAAAPAPPEAFAESEAPPDVSNLASGRSVDAGSATASALRVAPDAEAAMSDAPVPQIEVPAAVSAGEVLRLLREAQDPERVADALRTWRERWPDTSFGAVSDATDAELEALRDLAPEALRPTR